MTNYFKNLIINDGLKTIYKVCSDNEIMDKVMEDKALGHSLTECFLEGVALGHNYMLHRARLVCAIIGGIGILGVAVSVTMTHLQNKKEES